MALSVVISGASATIQSGSKTIGPHTIVGTATLDRIDALTLANGDNTFTVPTAPSGVVGCVIEPPSTNTNALKLKGAGADTGIEISKTGPTILNFNPASPPVSFIVNSTGAMTAGTVLTVTWF